MEYVGAETNMILLNELMEQVPFAVLLTDEQQRIIYANEQFITVTASIVSNIRGVPLSKVIHITKKLPFFETDEAECFEGEIVSSNTDKRLTAAIFSLRIKLANQSYNLIICTNIQEETKRTYLLKQFTDSLVTDTNLGILLFDGDGRLMIISDLACRILGVERDEVLNKSLEEAFPNFHDEHAVLQKMLFDRVTVRNYATSWSNGEQRYDLLADTHLLHDDTGEVIAAYIIFKDVTNLRSLDEQIQRNYRLAMIGQIAAGTAHEIRNPLTSLKGFLQVLDYSLSKKGLEKEQGYTRIMLKEIDRINDLVSEFLLLSRPRDAVYKEMRVSEVIDEILPFIRNEALLHKVEVDYISEKNIPKVVADSELLKQVLLNICKNGIEAMTDGGRLTIRQRYLKTEGYVAVDIHDTGPGIPHYVVDKIFDPFFTTKDEGTGLGLSVCQRIINDIGGSIRVSTKGFGTTFTILIPVHMKNTAH